MREREEEREACGEWFPWDYEGRFRPETFMRRNRIGPHSGFTRHDEAMRLPRPYAGGTFQRGAWIMSEEISKQLGLRAPSMVWFPGLDGGNPHWTNKFSLDGQRVTEASERDNPGYIASDGDRVIFAESRDDLNRTLYRFIGVFRGDFGGEHQGSTYFSSQIPDLPHPATFRAAQTRAQAKKKRPGRSPPLRSSTADPMRVH